MYNKRFSIFEYLFTSAMHGDKRVAGLSMARWFVIAIFVRFSESASGRASNPLEEIFNGVEHRKYSTCDFPYPSKFTDRMTPLKEQFTSLPIYVYAFSLP
jgi:hypothetical protein